MRRLIVLVAAAALPLPVRSAPHREDNAKWNVNFERRHSPAEYYGQWEGHTYHPSPPDWRALAIYQLITDRFADGDPRNNEAHGGGFDVRDMSFRHGGDFVGLREKLPYIRGLGCRAIWISPIFKNGDNSYHQYANHDFTLLDPRLGTLEELRQLTSAAHALDMYVLVDVVMNHMANVFAFEGHEAGGTPFVMHDNEEYKLVLRSSDRKLFSTPVGDQPYEDFWYNNTWDPAGSYGGPVYGRWGEAVSDEGQGTYSGSDFHHNGDLVDYSNPWQIHMGKIYGTMDDLRLESRRVQDKYIAMTKALISSADIDGLRVDTPMQVPLSFFKAWVPAIRAHAASLGKANFGIFGEFFVQPTRFATMTGRGRTPDMYGKEVFIDETPTMKGGIDYTYYWYLFTALVSKKPDFVDGLKLAFLEERRMLDLVDPASGQPEFAMWTFCNNHDNWRLQVMTSFAHMRLCQALISFWPGIPLHYAGDEQDFNTPGSALDGWAREELAASVAWRAAGTAPGGNPADGDSFDMASPSYAYIRRLNALRAAYLGGFGSPRCDDLDFPEHGRPGVLAFTRACTEPGRVAFVGNFDASDARNVSLATPWPPGTRLVDALPAERPLEVVAGPGGAVALHLAPLEAVLLVPGPVPGLPPAVVAVTPPHGQVVRAPAPGERFSVSLRFDRGVDGRRAKAAVRFDGAVAAQLPNCSFRCVPPRSGGGCAELVLSVDASAVPSGVHSVEVLAGVSATDGTVTDNAFRSMFIVEAGPGPLSHAAVRDQPGLICNYLTQLCHNAPGASWLRVQDVGGAWSPWQPYEAISDWRATPGRGVVVQYNLAGDCAAVAPAAALAAAPAAAEQAAPGAAPAAPAVAAREAAAPAAAAHAADAAPSGAQAAAPASAAPGGAMAGDRAAVAPAAAPAVEAPAVEAPAASAPAAAEPAAAALAGPDAAPAALASAPAVRTAAAAPGGAQAAAPPAAAVGAPAPASATIERVTAEVCKCKAVLECKDSTKFQLLAALNALESWGGLPDQVLRDTLIGKIVNSVAKSAADEAVQRRARQVVEAWRQAHRKRKGLPVEAPGAQPPLKRAVSSGLFQASDERTDSVATPTPLSRADSLLSLGEETPADSAAVGPIEPHREKVKQKLVEALGQAEEIEAKDGKQGAEENMRDPVRLASEMDEALHAALPRKEEYLAQARSILYNLKDKKNHTFRFKLMVGFFKPQDVPKLSAEDMASDEKNAERAKQRKDAMEALDQGWALKNGQQRITGMFTCGKCKGVKTTYFQMQTRSSDEPMTTFVTCLTCNNRWKFC